MLQTKKNAANGKVSFDKITFDEVGTYEYSVTEVEGSLGGVTYDEGTVEITVTVTDNLKGKLVAKVVCGSKKNFTNTYVAAPVIVDPPVQKIIENNDGLYNNSAFTFTIESTSAPEGVTAPMPENTSITNSPAYELADKKGYYEFGEIEFIVPGTYVYTVKESGSAPGVTNDSEAAAGKTLTFTVTDDGNGQLVVTPTTDQVELSFTNTYAAAEVTVDLSATKILTGRDLTEGEFSFKLELDGGLVETVVNAADGSIVFGTLTFEEAGTYTFKVYEVEGKAENVTYDETVYEGTITVSDNGEGELEAVVEGGEDIVFNNTYETPETPPDTGDHSNPYIWIALAISAFVGMIITVLFGRKAKKAGRSR